MDLSLAGTPYFRIVDGVLRRAVKMELPGDYNGTVKCCLSEGDESYEVEAIAKGGMVLVCGLATFDRLKPAASHADSTAVDKVGFSISFSGGCCGLY